MNYYVMNIDYFYLSLIGFWQPVHRSSSPEIQSQEISSDVRIIFFILHYFYTHASYLRLRMPSGALSYINKCKHHVNESYKSL